MLHLVLCLFNFRRKNTITDINFKNCNMYFIFLKDRVTLPVAFPVFGGSNGSEGVPTAFSISES